MKKNTVFIDGSSGTTGLQVASRLSQRVDINLVILAKKDRKSKKKRSEAMQYSDVTILCLRARNCARDCDKKTRHNSVYRLLRLHGA